MVWLTWLFNIWIHFLAVYTVPEQYRSIHSSLNIQWSLILQCLWSTWVAFHCLAHWLMSIIPLTAVLKAYVGISFLEQLCHCNREHCAVSISCLCLSPSLSNCFLRLGALAHSSLYGHCCDSSWLPGIW